MGGAEGGGGELGGGAKGAAAPRVVPAISLESDAREGCCERGTVQLYLYANTSGMLVQLYVSAYSVYTAVQYTTGVRGAMQRGQCSAERDEKWR